MRDSQEVVGAAKNSWLLRDYVEPRGDAHAAAWTASKSYGGSAKASAAPAQR